MNFKINQQFLQLLFVFMAIFLIAISLLFVDADKNSLKFVQFFSFIGTRITSPVRQIVRCDKLAQKNQILAQKNRKLEGKIAKLNEVEKENKELKKELNVKATENKKKIKATIIGRSSNPSGHVALIDKGRNQGVNKGANVSLPGGILFGQVVTVFSNYSKVIPITNESLSVAAIEQENRVEGVLRGRGAQSKPVFDLMSPDKELKKGPILSSGLDQKFVPGLLIGEIIEIQFYPQESSKRGLLEPAFEFDRVKSVFILSPDV